jgi:hypothetical protein
MLDQRFRTTQARCSRQQLYIAGKPQRLRATTMHLEGQHTAEHGHLPFGDIVRRV